MDRGLLCGALCTVVGVVFIFAVVGVGMAVHSPRAGEVAGLLFSLPVFAGIPCAVFAASRYSRLVVEPGVGVRKYAVNRITGTVLSLDITWSELKHLAVDRVLVCDDDNVNPWYTLSLSAVVEQGRRPLGHFDGGVGVWSVEQRVALLRRYSGDRLSLAAELCDPPTADRPCAADGGGL